MSETFDRYKLMLKQNLERSAKGMQECKAIITDKKQRIEKLRAEKAKEHKKGRDDMKRLLQTVNDCLLLGQQDDDDDEL